MNGSSLPTVNPHPNPNPKQNANLTLTLTLTQTGTGTCLGLPIQAFSSSDAPGFDSQRPPFLKNRYLPLPLNPNLYYRLSDDHAFAVVQKCDCVKGFNPPSCQHSPTPIPTSTPIPTVALTLPLLLPPT